MNPNEGLQIPQGEVSQEISDDSKLESIKKHAINKAFEIAEKSGNPPIDEYMRLMTMGGYENEVADVQSVKDDISKYIEGHSYFDALVSRPKIPEGDFFRQTELPENNDSDIEQAA